MDTYLAVASKRDWRSYADRPIPDDVVSRILDAGRVTGSGSNKQPWTFVVVEAAEPRQRVAETVYAAGNVLGAALAIAIATSGGSRALDVGRAMQNMMLVAWNEGVVSCPNGMPDRARAAQALGLEGDLEPVTVLTFAYPRRPLDPESKTAEEWSREANRKPLEEVVRRVEQGTERCYGGRVTTLNLRTLKLRSGEQFVDEREIQLEPLELGGQRYLPVPETVSAELSVTRASTGTVFELRFRNRLHGPCYRCLADAVLELPISAREYQATNPDSDELRTPYLEDDRLDLSAWARDAVALALPLQILCRPDCAGLCPVCGKDLNAEAHIHDEEHADSRWAALAELRDQL